MLPCESQLLLAPVSISSTVRTPRSIKRRAIRHCLAKWAQLAADDKDKKGWAKVFPGGVALWNVLTWGWFWIEAAGTGGGGFRALYAAFLDEAHAITGLRALAGAAAAYRALGAAWTALAGGLLPDAVPLLRVGAGCGLSGRLGHRGLPRRAGRRSGDASALPTVACTRIGGALSDGAHSGIRTVL